MDGEEQVGYPSTKQIVYDNNSVLIGADINNDERLPDQGWNGLIDEVSIYNRSLAQAEITQILPEFPSVLTMPILMSATIIGVIAYTRKRRKRTNLSLSRAPK